MEKTKRITATQQVSLSKSLCSMRRPRLGSRDRCEKGTANNWKRLPMCLGARRIAVHEEVTTMTYTGDAPSPTKTTSIERDQLSLVQIVPPPRGDAEVSGFKRIQLAEVGGSAIKTTE